MLRIVKFVLHCAISLALVEMIRSKFMTEVCELVVR